MDNKVQITDYNSQIKPTWCPGCGNFMISSAIKSTLVELNISPKDAVITFDIGCSGNGSDKIGGYRIKGLHGRSLPLAAGIALANRKLTVIATGGDGATLNEGIGHLVHAIRSDYDLLFIIHNNSNFSLTKGQASASSAQKMPMDSSPDGMIEDTMNIMTFVLSLNPSFAARTYSGNIKHMTEVFKQGIIHKGLAVVEVLQSCPSYNKLKTPDWFKQRVFELGETYDKTNLRSAVETASDMESKIALGVLYQDKNRKDYYSRIKNRQGINTELVDEVKEYNVSKLVEKFV